MTDGKGRQEENGQAGQNDTGQPVVIVAGPTASGKSALALAVATEFEGVVINADSMQIYKELPILTGQPSRREMAVAPHRLYGILAGRDPCSAARWRAMALKEIEQAGEVGRLPLLVGGTGLYLRALMAGLAPVPEVPPPVRAASRALLAEVGAPELHQRLAARDPVMAERTSPTDSQRLLRAWEVLEATGRSLADWQDDEPKTHAPDRRFLTILMMPPREAVYAACDARFSKMVEQGAVAEVAAVLAQEPEPGLPVMKAVGLREIADHLGGSCSLAEAVQRGQQSTRRYAKRQYTWFRRQMVADAIIREQYSESLMPRIFAKIRHLLLTPPN